MTFSHSWLNLGLFNDFFQLFVLHGVESQGVIITYFMVGTKDNHKIFRLRITILGLRLDRWTS
jgi:hypothetical protein